MTNSISPTKFSIYATNPKHRRQLIRELQAQKKKGEGGNYYAQLYSKIKYCEKNNKLYELHNQMLTQKYSAPKKRTDLVNFAAKYQKVRGDLGVVNAGFPGISYEYKNKFKIRKNPDVIWDTRDQRLLVGFYLSKLDNTRLTQRKAELMSSIIMLGRDYNPYISTLICDLENGDFFRFMDDGSRLLPSINKWSDEINSKMEENPSSVA